MISPRFCDVQRCSDSCDEWIRGATAVIDGKAREFSMTGNAYLVRVFPTWVLILECYADDDDHVIVSPSTFLAAVSYWKSAVECQLNDGIDAVQQLSPLIVDDPSPSEAISAEEIRCAIDGS